MRKYLKKAVFILFVVFVGIQFIPTNRNESTEILATDISLVFDVPEAILATLKTSCYDCHSNNTIYPWYNKVQPVSWFLEDHIARAKAELNFSDFGSYSKRRQKNKLKSIASQIKDDKMPLSSYSLMHSDAVLSKDKKAIFFNWIDKL